MCEKESIILLAKFIEISKAVAHQKNYLKLEKSTF